MKLSEKLFGLLIILLPIQLGKHFWPDFSLVYGLRIDYLSPTIYLTDILIFLTIFFWFIEEKPKIKISFWAIIGLFCLLLGIVFSKNLGTGIYKLVKLVEFGLLAAYVYRLKNAGRYLLRFLPWALVFTSVIAIFQFCRQGSLNGWFWFLGERPLSAGIPGIALENLGGNLFLRSYATFSHPNSMAGFLLIGLILTLGKFRKSKFFWGYAGLILWALFLSFSYSAWLVGATTLIFYFFLVKKKLSLIIAVFLSGGLLVLGVSQLNSQPVTERWQLIAASFSIIKDNFFFGVGLNNFIVKLADYRLPESFRLWQPVHNVYLLIFAETGIVVFSLVLLFILLTLKKLLTVSSHLLFLSVSAILLLGIFDHYWFTLQQNQILLSIVLGLAWRKNLSKELQ